MINWLSPTLSYSSDDELLYKAHIEFIRMISKTYIYCTFKVVFDVGYDTSINCKVFQHLTTVGTGNGRLLDIERTKRIHWIEEVLLNYGNKKVFIYDELIKNNVRIHFIVPSAFYMVVIEKNKRGCFIITAYHLDNKNRVASYMKKYSNFKKKQKSAQQV